MLSLEYALHAREPGVRVNGPVPAEHRPLLTAALAEPDTAVAALHDWLAAHPLAGTIEHLAYVLLPGIYRRLSLAGVDLPERARLASTYRHTWALNQRLHQSLHRYTRALDAEGIPFVVIKGPWLLAYAYGDPGTRPTSDLDLVIRPADLPRLEQWLAREGFRPTHEPPPPHHFARTCGLGYRRAGDVDLDIHWHPFMADTPVAAEERFWADSVWMELQGARVRVPSPLDGFLLTLWHGRKPDPGSRLRWIVDAAMQLRRAPVDGAALLARAADTRLLQACVEALPMLAEFEALDLPPLPAVPALPKSARLYGLLQQYAAAGCQRSVWADPLRKPRSLALHGLDYWLTTRSLGQPAGPIGLLRHYATLLQHRRRRP
ncbi:MAG: nucleotidyltransferase family protein [Xanthomonadales bacterium]|jgi:hypothetical protein|nr:nucleotidyltransferase family protein [Xanthomonadales bacterium]